MTNVITPPRIGAHDSGDAAPTPRSRPHPVADSPRFARPPELRIDSSIPGELGPASGNGTVVSNAAAESRAPEPEDDSPRVSRCS